MSTSLETTWLLCDLQEYVSHNGMPEMPVSFTMWDNAMKHMDKDLSRVRKGIVYQNQPL